MGTVVIALKANQPTRQGFGVAQYLTLTDLGVTPTVDLAFEVSGFSLETVARRKAGDRFSVPAPGFQAVSFTAPVDCVIEVFASMIDLRLNTSDGSTVNANIVGTVPVSVNSPLPLPVAYTGVAQTNRSGAIVAGGVAQQLMAANAARRGLWVQNLSATDALWFYEGGAAVQGQPAVKVAPGALYEAPMGGCPTGAISVIGPTAGQSFSAREW